MQIHENHWKYRKYQEIPPEAKPEIERLERGSRLSLNRGARFWRSMPRDSWKSLKTNENARESMQIMKIYKNPWNTLKWFRGQEASLKSSKVFFRSSRLFLDRGASFWRFMPRDSWKSMNTNENARKSMCTSLKIFKNVWNTMKSFRNQEASLKLSKGFYRDSRLSLNLGARF